ncbi:MAG: hypothetical protein QM783_02280 [Phycisphaerales bacterium]
MRPTRVVVCTAAVGCGHTRAALALREGILAQEPDAQIEFIETLDHASGWFVRPYRDGYLAAVGKMPALAGWLYKRTDKVGGGAFGRTVERRGLRQFCSHPSLTGADLVVTTHFLCARVLAGLRSAGSLRAPVAVCVTDVHPHAVWLSKGIDALLVAANSSRETALKAGLPSNRVHVTGIPIDRRFETSEDQGLARFELGLPPQGERPVVLVAGGGLGLGGIEGVVSALMRRNRPVHVAVICGRNATLRRAVEPLRASGRRRGLMRRRAPSKGSQHRCRDGWRRRICWWASRAD